MYKEEMGDPNKQDPRNDMDDLRKSICEKCDPNLQKHCMISSGKHNAGLEILQAEACGSSRMDAKKGCRNDDET